VNILLKNNLEEIRGLCRKYGIDRLTLFGPATGPDLGAKAVDFLVHVEGLPPCEYSGIFTDFKQDMEDLLGRDTNLISAVSMKSPAMQESVNRNNEVLYESNQ